MTDLVASEAIDIEPIGDCSMRNSVFDRLVLENGYKEMILSLTAQHFRDKEPSMGPTKQVDIVKGKGIEMHLDQVPHLLSVT